MGIRGAGSGQAVRTSERLRPSSHCLSGAGGESPAAAPRAGRHRPSNGTQPASLADNAHPRGLPASAGAARSGTSPTPVAGSAARLALAQESTAGQPAPSVQEAKRLRAAEQAKEHAEARVWFERGLSAEQAGNLGAAKAYYHLASRRADDALKREIHQRIAAIREPPRGTVF